MDKRKSTLSGKQMCRFCLSQDNSSLTSLYDRTRTAKKGVNLQLQILKCIGVEVFPSDGLPSFICECCRFFMDINFEYKQMCRMADENVFNHVQKGDNLKPLTYPANLLKLFRSTQHLTSNATPKSKDMQTLVTEGGALIEVTSQDLVESDEDDEDGEVYNIKFSKNAAEGKGVTTVKVVTDGEDSVLSTNVTSPTEGGDGEAVDYPMTDIAIIPTRKVVQEPRPFTCEQCNQRFYTEDEMEKHMSCHETADVSVKCDLCKKQFKNERTLKIHEKRMHGDSIVGASCEECDATNLSPEELKTHILEHSKNGDLSLTCDVCHTKFKNVRSLRRHEKQVHNRNFKFSCQMCSEQFDTVQKLAKHAHTHTGGSGFQCKYCDKSFGFSHHYARHLRLSHRMLDHGGQSEIYDDPYQCDECGDTFLNQDELIYHSAIHATQNLTCPLCQEKFDNVDAVTVHIKSHVEGVQFMCELCELVFTSKGKLESHTIKKHADEQESLTEEDDSRIEEEDCDEEENMSVSEEGDHMIVQIKKPDEFIISTNEIPQVATAKPFKEVRILNSEAVLTRIEDPVVKVDLPLTVDMPELGEDPIKPKSPLQITEVKLNSKVELQLPQQADNTTEKITNKILVTTNNKEEVNKPKNIQQIIATASEKTSERPESTPIAGASDKSLKLLEKELQELKRTSSRGNGNNDLMKTPLRPELRGRRPQLATSTPKKSVELRRFVNSNEKRRAAVTKENAEPKEKDNKINNNNTKEDGQDKENGKEKDKEHPKEQAKSTTSEKTPNEDGVRRSRRSSKIKDYAKMVFSISSSEEDSDDEFVEQDTSNRARPRKSVGKPTRMATPEPEPVSLPTTPSARKRGRPRTKTPVVPIKVVKVDSAVALEKIEEAKKNSIKEKADTSIGSIEDLEEGVKADETKESEANSSQNTTVDAAEKSISENSDKSSQPEVLPTMQMGSKTVKVKKILMTKAEVARMVKDGHVEIMNGHVVVKSGIKLPGKFVNTRELIVATNLWNNLPQNIRQASTRFAFKRMVYSYLNGFTQPLVSMASVGQILQKSETGPKEKEWYQEIIAFYI